MMRERGRTGTGRARRRPRRDPHPPPPRTLRTRRLRSVCFGKIWERTYRIAFGSVRRCRRSGRARFRSEKKGGPRGIGWRVETSAGVAEKRRFFRRFKKKEKPIFRSSDAFGYGNGWRFLSARSFRLSERGVANRLSHPQRVVVTAERARKRLFLRDRKVLRKPKRETSANATGRGLRRAISVPIRTISPS